MIADIAISLGLAVASGGLFVAVGSVAFIPLQIVPIIKNINNLQELDGNTMDELLNDAFNGTDTNIDDTLADISASAVSLPEQELVDSTVSTTEALVIRSKNLKLIAYLTHQLELASQDTADIVPIESSFTPTEGEMHVYWDDYRIENSWWIEAVMELGIDGASDVLVETEKLVAKGKLVASARRSNPHHQVA